MDAGDGHSAGKPCESTLAPFSIELLSSDNSSGPSVLPRRQATVNGQRLFLVAAAEHERWRGHRQGESTALSPLSLIYSYKYEKSLCGTASCDPGWRQHRAGRRAAGEHRMAQPYRGRGRDVDQAGDAGAGDLRGQAHEEDLQHLHLHAGAPHQALAFPFRACFKAPLGQCSSASLDVCWAHTDAIFLHRGARTDARWTTASPRCGPKTAVVSLNAMASRISPARSTVACAWNALAARRSVSFSASIFQAKRWLL